MSITSGHMPAKPSLRAALYAPLRPFEKLDYTGFAGVEGDPYIAEWGKEWVIIHDITRTKITIQAINQVTNETLHWEVSTKPEQICPPEA
jgi:hypothetical protein